MCCVFQPAAVVVLFTTFVINLNSCYAGCQDPLKSSSMLSLSASKNLFDPGDVIELVCIPGFDPGYSFKLTCQSSDEWLGQMPTCEKSLSRITVRWWLLFIIVVSIIIILPCILPRIYYNFFDERHVTRKKLLRQRKTATDEVDYASWWIGTTNRGDVIRTSTDEVQATAPVPLPKYKNHAQPHAAGDVFSTDSYGDLNVN